MILPAAFQVPRRPCLLFSQTISVVIRAIGRGINGQTALGSDMKNSGKAAKRGVGRNERYAGNYRNGADLCTVI